MFKKLLTYCQYGSLYCGIEHTHSEGKDVLHSLLLKKQNDEFLIQKTITCETTVELKNHLPKEQHVFLTINTDKVLSKTLKGNFPGQKAVSTAFSNLNHNDFYYETYTGTENTYVTISRKDYVDKLINTYKEQGMYVVGFSLGNLIAAQLKGIIDKPYLITNNAKISCLEKDIQDIQLQSVLEIVNYNINGLVINNQQVLSLAGIIAYYTNQYATESNSYGVIRELRDTLKQQRIFKLGLTASLSVAFLLLLGSFLFFSLYSSKIDALNTELTLNKTYKDALVQLTNEVRKKERLVTDFSLATSKVSWYLDQLGNSLPHTLSFTELQYQPTSGNIKKDKLIEIEENRILISGETMSNEDFSTWMNTVEEMNWIEKVIINDYGTGKGTKVAFQLTLIIKI